MTHNTWDEGGMSFDMIYIENHIDICFIGISKDIYKEAHIVLLKVL